MKPTPRTPKEIESEIKALKALKPVGQFASKTAATIAAALDELQGNSFDQTAPEWDELPDERRDMIQQTIDWKEGYCDDAPSQGWGGLIE